MSSRCRSRSAVEISRLSALAFQMSHITQRQLQALCTRQRQDRQRLDPVAPSRLQPPAASRSVDHQAAPRSRPGSPHAHGRRATRNPARQRAAARRPRAPRACARSTAARRRPAASAGTPTSGRPSIIVSRTSARVDVTSACAGASGRGASTVRSAGSAGFEPARTRKPQHACRVNGHRARNGGGRELSGRGRAAASRRGDRRRRSAANRSRCARRPTMPQTAARPRCGRRETRSTSDTR